MQLRIRHSQHKMESGSSRPPGQKQARQPENGAVGNLTAREEGRAFRADEPAFSCCGSALGRAQHLTIELSGAFGGGCSVSHVVPGPAVGCGVSERRT